MDLRRNSTFWLWWALTLSAGVWQILRAWHRPRELLGFGTVASVLWLYVYGYLPYQLIIRRNGAFSEEIWNFGQFTACVSLLSLLVGWHWKLAQARSFPAPSLSFGVNRIWCCGVVALLVGLAGFYSFQSSGRDPQETSAYWYLLFNTCYPGMALCVVAITLSPDHRSWVHWSTLAVLSGLIIVPFLVGARRGPTFAAIMALFFSFAAVRRRPLHPAVPLAVLCCAGLLLLIQVTARRVTYSGEGTWSDFLNTFQVEEVLAERAQKTSDNEYFNHCQILEANLRTGLFQYGTAHLAVLVNWIPRAWWPAKPERSSGFYPEAMRTLVAGEESNLGVGGAWGAVADSFNNYWYFFPGFWLGIGWLTAGVFLKAQQVGALSWKMYNVGILCASHWFIAQTFAEAFVPFMIYQGVFVLAFWHSARRIVRRRGTRRPPRPQPRLGPEVEGASVP